MFLVLTAVGLVAGAIAGALGAGTVAGWAWAATTVAGLAPATWWVIRAARQRHLGVDVVAVLALVGTLAIGEYLAGAVISLMLASGRALEARAGRRARRDLSALLDRAPRRAHRRIGDQIESIDVDAIRPGDVVLVKPGEVVPIDGSAKSACVLDESSLTGESRVVEYAEGEPVRSGVVNAGAAFDLLATTTAADSTYAGIVRLVAEAESSTAPFVRLADRYAGAFLAVSVVAAALAWWSSGQLVRAVAVLVVATPCPLILAAPVAIVGGLSCATRRGVIVKGGGALEQLGAARVLLFDKTGTLTAGRPRLARLVRAGSLGDADALRLAASLDQLSPHVIAAAVVAAARDRALPLAMPVDVTETAGDGVRGIVDGHEVRLGTARFAGIPASLPWVTRLRRRAQLDGSTLVFETVDDEAVGALVFDDPIRPDAARTIRDLRDAGVEHVVMVTGDNHDVAASIGSALGVDAVIAERSPADKVDAVDAQRGRGVTVMVGDGINDAPALARADVGVAMGARGATAASEAADVVLVSDRLDRLADAIAIARRSRRIAWQSVVTGMALSATAMVVAGVGYLPPVAGAVVQEAIDMAVIANALRALRQPARNRRVSGADAALGRRFAAEHAALHPRLLELRAAADGIGDTLRPDDLARVSGVHAFLVSELLPHEAAEDTELYPVMARVLGGSDPTGAMSRSHAEIDHLVRRLGFLLEEAGDGDRDASIAAELRAVLYGLHAVLELHFAQEDEGYLSLALDDAVPA